ncbi:MAG TPA: hypothetical protein P5235_11180, partial [Saprospiraceae bacterium]|nr:hypothetical protein [Saprospiraceae bacterium]
MSKQRQLIFAVFILIFSYNEGITQSYFYKLSLSKTMSNDKNSHSISASMEDEFDGQGLDYLNLSLQYDFQHKIISNFLVLKSGMRFGFVKDKLSTDFTEMRPYVGAANSVVINDHFTWKNVVRFEYRMLNQDMVYDFENNFTRFRFSTGMLYKFMDSQTHNIPWTLKLNFESFFVENKQTFERYSNLHEWSLTWNKNASEAFSYYICFIYDRNFSFNQ